MPPSSRPTARASYARPPPFAEPTLWPNLPPRAREALLLRRVDGLSRAEIAQRMGIGEGTVKEYLSESVCALADMLYGETEIARRRP